MFKSINIKKLSKNYKQSDFDAERRRRTMFSRLKIGEKPP